MRQITIVLLLLASISMSAQTYSKDMEKRAKKGDVAAQYETGLCYLNAYGVASDIKKARKWLEAAADQGHADAIFQLAMIGKSENSGNWQSLLEQAANSNSADAQYELYKSSGDSKWLEKAADNGNANALEELLEEQANSFYEKAKATEDKQEKLALLEMAAARGHTISIAESVKLKKQIEREQKEEEARLRAEQLKAIEEGRMLPSYDFIQSNIPILNISSTYPKTINFPDHKILSLCQEDVFAYTERWNMDNLDKALYMKSDDYKTDMNSLKDDKDMIYAYMFDLANSNHQKFWADFDVDGITFNCYNINNETNLPYAHIGVDKIAIPVQPDVTTNGWRYFFSCNDINALKKVKDYLGQITFVILFKPAFAKSVNSAGLFSLGKNDVAIVNPVAIFLLDKKSGQVVLDLSEHIREVGSEAGHKAEVALIENVNKKEKAIRDKWEKDYKDAQAKKKYHKAPKEVRCWLCFGKGLTRGVNSAGVPGEGAYQRCSNCYGRGYTLEHYY